MRLYIIGGLVYVAVADGILGHCFLCVADAYTETQGLISASASTLIYGAAESAPEPPWGGEICAGEKVAKLKEIIRGDPKLFRL